MEIFSLNGAFSDRNIILFFYKAFTLSFAFIYFLYAVVLKKQTSVMNNTVKASSSGFISFVSLIQIFLAIILIILAIFA